jgi:hypothetical protein
MQVHALDLFAVGMQRMVHAPFSVRW